ncbi:MAG: hypothetical protein JO182_28065 [Acidobacteriaceae bacterium]|nr:hypothetical protein [Acidobacteriaceae bacterium]MBV9038376.1 hypothetical protein [Acidobacteriaceae bacterium]MBV9678240.1 hypothetical protein [Acidobacteriaceae bacterium]MBV9938262.1 hypothetical protein [Acidobacteriaceae bacterium]
MVSDLVSSYAYATFGSVADIKQLKEWIERVLPQIAKEQQWPIRFDHCFKRICLDNAFEDV